MAAMDSGRRSLHWVLPLFLLFLFELACVVKGNLVFEVRHKYAGSRRGKVSMRELKAHDIRRHGRSLAAVDFDIGGDGSPTSAALYFTKVKIGSPPVEFHVQIDTGSDILWVNCKDCDNCPTKSDLDIELQQYDLKESSTGSIVTCDQEFCATVFKDSPLQNCKVGKNCEYSLSYGDGSITAGSFVRDTFTFNQVSGNNKTSAMTGSIAFGCSSKQSGASATSSQAVDGIVGLGQANTSILSQLASAGKVKKKFSHCLNGKGGGIFAIGEVVQTAFGAAPLIPNQAHYNAELESVEAGDVKLQLPSDLLGSSPAKWAIIDSGTTLAYLTSGIYKQLLAQIMSKQPNLKMYVLEEQFQCFSFSGNVDIGFPLVKFIFKNSLTLPVYPHDYLFEVDDDEYCIGWQNTQAKDEEETTLLGDLALTDKLVVYDLENQTVGWTEYDCSTGIKVKDDVTGNVYDVYGKSWSGSPVLSSSAQSILLFIAAVLYLME